MVKERAADGGIAADYTMVNGLSRANRNACAEYGRRRRHFVNKVSIW